MKSHCVLIALTVIFVPLMLMPGVAVAQNVVGWRGDWTGRYPNATPVTEWGYWPKSPSWGLGYQLAKPQASDTGVNATPVTNRQLLEWLVLGPFVPNDAKKALDEAFIPNEADVQPIDGDKAGDLAWKKHVSLNKDPGLMPDVIQLDAVAKGTPNGVV